jgi:hypothetical protein
MRADATATTPMLRQAIETDAATMNDLVNLGVFNTDRGEALEVFQFRGERSISLLRIPKTALSVEPLKGRATRFQSDGKGVTLAASAPISAYRAGVAGGLVISSPIDLTSIKRAFAEHATSARLTGLGADLVLVGSGDGVDATTSVKLAVPSTGNWDANRTMVTATSKRAIGLAWAGYVFGLSGGLAVLLLAGFVISLVRRTRSR